MQFSIHSSYIFLSTIFTYFTSFTFKSLRIMMVSIFRLRDSMLVSSQSGDQSSKRYIITAPQSDFVLFPTDMVFVLMQFDQGTQYRPLVEGKYT